MKRVVKEEIIRRFWRCVLEDGCEGRIDFRFLDFQSLKDYVHVQSQSSDFRYFGCPVGHFVAYYYAD